jgi:hypothetical protein
MRSRALVALLLGVAASATPGARANPVTQDACAGTVKTTVFKTLGNDVLENLLFAEGAIWISDSTAGEVRSFAPDGASGKSVKIASPGGLVAGIDGRIYAGQGDSIQGALARDGKASVVSFDPRAAAPVAAAYASGFNMVNGLTGAPNGDLYLSNDVDTGLYRVPRADPAHPQLLNDTWGTNGLVLAGDKLFSAVTFDARAPIEVTDLSKPGNPHSTAYRLSAGAASAQPALYPGGLDPSKPLGPAKGLDDMTSDGTYLYPVANGQGELLRVNIAAGDTCLVTSGLQNPSSVRIAPAAFADHTVPSGSVDFYVTEFSGNVRHVVYTPA